MKKDAAETERRWGAFLISLLFLFYAGDAWAAMGEISKFSVLDDNTTDLVGKGTTLGPDGLMDAGFSLSVRGNGAITRIVLTNTTNGKRWDTSTASGYSLLGVCSDKNETLNVGGDMMLYAFVFGVHLSVWVNDREATLAKDGTYEITVYFVDKSTARATVAVKGIAPPAQTGTTAKTPTIASAILRGPRSEDFAGSARTDKKIGKSGKNDWATEVKVNAIGTITGFRIRNTSGAEGVWDTFPNSNNPLIAVMSDGSVTLPKIFNRNDGSVSIPISGDMTFYLLVEDNGSLGDPGTASVAMVYMDEKISEAAIARDLPETGRSFDVVSFDYNGRGKYDFVSNSPKLESNLFPDMGLTVTLDARGTINGIRITSSWDGEDGKKVSRTWDTIPSNTVPLVAVTRKDGKLLNKSDSTVLIPVNGRETLCFWIDNDEDIGANGIIRADIAFTDGRILTATWAAAAPPAVAAEKTDKQDRSIRMTAKPALLKTGVVKKLETPAPGSKNNMSMIVRVRGAGTIVRMSLINQSGAGSWDTTPKNNIPLLGVREKTKLLNAQDGTVKIAVKNSTDLELVVEDNGSVKKGNARFLLSIAWSDGEITKELLTW